MHIFKGLFILFFLTFNFSSDVFIEFLLFVNLKKVKEADLYSAFIEVPYTQGAQVWITQCYLQVLPANYVPASTS